MVLTESGTECTLVHGNSQNFLAASAPSVVTEDDDYGQEGIFDTANWAFSSTKIQGFYLFNTENILGIGIPHDQTLQTSIVNCAPG